FPPIVLKILRHIYNPGIKFVGNYSSWEEASKKSTGYNHPEILQRVRDFALKVKRGEAVYERDGVIFNEIQYSWPLLAGLLYAAAITGRLRVCDFGGSLGTTYFQNRMFLQKISDVKWGIVEQREFVDIGKQDFEDSILRFYYDVDTCIREIEPDVLILSGVLQYIHNPFELLGSLLSYNFNYIIIDRTPFSNRRHIKVQIVPENIYKTSYPLWIFEEQEFLRVFKEFGYNVITRFKAIDAELGGYQHLGFIMEKLYT
ncbi:MAG: methyltransferase, TIGR04325 family, partial [Thermodesulfovibrio sp.]|nr:methyltransferase, TIGR04325 family [Thermodesulfovibrio sp.]